MKLLKPEQFGLKREVEYGTPEQNADAIKIVTDVKVKGDEALLHYTEKLDRVKLSAQQLRVTEAEIQAAYEQVDQPFLDAIRDAAVNIRRYHEKQLRNSWMDLSPDGTMLGQLIRPLKRVGVYVPGGRQLILPLF